MLSEKKLSLLIVDDDLELCAAFKSHLENHPQFDVMNPVTSGDEAIEIIEQHKPDIVILDLVLPVYDGMYIVDYITEEIKEYQPIIYILSIMSSVKTSKMLNDCTAVKYYSIKPIKPQTVINNLFRLMKDSQATEAEEIQRTHDIKRDTYRAPDISRIILEEMEGLDWLIEDYLKSLGLQSSLISTKCARVAIEIGLKSDINNRVGMMDMYNQAGQIFTPPISATAVDRNIRSVTARVTKNRTPVFEKYFTPNQCSGEYQLYNSLFVWDSVDILRRWIVENPDGKTFS